jgi:hypothetical protein
MKTLEELTSIGARAMERLEYKGNIKPPRVLFFFDWHRHQVNIIIYGGYGPFHGLQSPVTRMPSREGKGCRLQGSTPRSDRIMEKKPADSFIWKALR